MRFTLIIFSYTIYDLTTTLRNIVYFISAIIIASCSQVEKKQSQEDNSVFDVVILGGRVMDPETGIDATKNVGILDGTIRVISDSLIEGKEVIHASGLVVAPGFIDTDNYAANAELQVADGVTTVLNLRKGTNNVDNWYDEHFNKMLINYGVGISYHDIREQVMGEHGRLQIHRKEPTDDQFKKILNRLSKEFDNGAVALGMGGSGGYDPAGWELIEIFKVAAEEKAHVVATLRDDLWDESNITANLLQMIGAASLSGAHIHIPHIGSSAGPHMSRFLEVLAYARANGISITAEDYPYSAAEIDVKKGELYTMTDEEIHQVQPMDSDSRLTRETIGMYGEKNFEAYYHNDGIEPFIIEGIRAPFVQIASHGSNLKWTEKGIGHPRTAGTYSRVLGKYVREKSVISLMEALRKMTLLPAELLSARVPTMQKKGRIQVGADADIVVFDSVKVIDRATFTKQIPSTGIEYVLVNGIIVVKQGSIQKGVFPGNAIRSKL